nr:unnamed protein product [Callosobruchus chinensis]
MPRNELSAFERTRIIALWQEGLSRHQIANRLNVVRSTVRREDRYIAQLARRERSVLASGLWCRRPLRVPLFTSCHRTARLQWARAHQDWLLPQWRNVLFSGESRFGLVSGTMTGAYHLQNSVNAIVQPLRNEIGDQFIFMDDNARFHRTRAVQQALENGNIARLEWPVMSPDMNPIEHVWDYVSRAIFNRNNPPRSTQQLIVAATEGQYSTRSD